MLDLKFIRQNPNLIKDNVQRRGLNVDIDRLLLLDKQKNELTQKIDTLLSQRKKISKELQEKGKEQVEKIKNEISELEKKRDEVANELDDILFQIPNLLSPLVPLGKNEKENKEIKNWGEKAELEFKARDHVEIGKILDILDLEAGAKVTGSGFFFLKNEGALLELALVQYVFSLLVSKGFISVITPELVRKEIAFGTGYLPRREEPEIYKIENENLYLSATAEIPLTALHADQILEIKKLPLRYVGFSSCFRKEAGSWGKHAKGAFRVHEFDKVEIYLFAKPEESEKMFEEIIALEEEIYQGLEIPYRIVNVCTGDMSAPAFLKYDFEYWSPVDKEYREITSCSNCTDFQARRLGIRFRNEEGKLEYVHTLNGTAITSSRTMIAILENYQQEDGSVKIPRALQKYVGKEIIKRKIF